MYDYPPSDRFNVQRPVEHYVFFAIRPDVAAMFQASDVGEDLRGRYGIADGLKGPGRFHITLFGICQEYSVPQKIVADAMRAAGSMASPAFDITLDRAVSFRHPARRPLVLCGSKDGVAQLHRFRQSLGLALVGAGFKHCGQQSFNPHMTLLYDHSRRTIAEHQIDPIHWTARELVLIDSVRPLGQHNVLGRWPLRGEPNG